MFVLIHGGAGGRTLDGDAGCGYVQARAARSPSTSRVHGQAGQTVEVDPASHGPGAQVGPDLGRSRRTAQYDVGPRLSESGGEGGDVGMVAEGCGPWTGGQQPSVGQRLFDDDRPTGRLGLAESGPDRWLGDVPGRLHGGEHRCSVHGHIERLSQGLGLPRTAQGHSDRHSEPGEGPVHGPVFQDTGLQRRRVHLVEAKPGTRAGRRSLAIAARGRRDGDPSPPESRRPPASRRCRCIPTSTTP